MEIERVDDPRKRDFLVTKKMDLNKIGTKRSRY